MYFSTNILVKSNFKFWNSRIQIIDIKKDTGVCVLSKPGMSNFLASLGHTGRGVVLGHTLNMQTLTKTDGQKQNVHA